MDGLRSPMRMLVEGAEGAVLLVLAVVTWPVSRFFLANFGALPEERDREWPGDRLLAKVDSRAIRAITIDAPAAEVWPWLVQFGLGRGGFHSYELLERLGGIDVRNVERILPHLQSLELGQEVVLHPSAPALTVALIEPDEALCLRTWKDEQDLSSEDPAVLGSFSQYLSQRSADSCRFLVRTCKHERRRRSWVARFVATFLEDPLDLVMEYRMLRTVRRLAERRGV